MAEQQHQQPDEFTTIINGSRDIDAAAEELVTGPKPEGARVDEVIDPVEAWASIPKLVRPFALPLVPKGMEGAWSDDGIREWARNAHRAFPTAEGMPPMVGFALASLGLALPVLLGIKMRKAQADAARKLQQAGESPENPGVPSGATVAQ